MNPANRIIKIEISSKLLCFSISKPLNIVKIAFLLEKNLRIIWYQNYGALFFPTIKPSKEKNHRKFDHTVSDQLKIYLSQTFRNCSPLMARMKKWHDSKFKLFSVYFLLFPYPKKFSHFFPHTGKNRNRRKSNLLP